MAAWQDFVPGVGLFRSYQRGWLGKDVVAGLVLSALLVPQGMAYAELAGLPPVTGLYTSILCLLGYALFGPSRILVLGPDSSLGPMIAATIAPLALAGGDPAKAVALASVLALLVGVVMTVAGLAHLGFVADLLSKPTQIGYMNGLALTIVVGQLPKLFGFSVDADGLIAETRAFLTGRRGPARQQHGRADRRRLAARHPPHAAADPQDPRGPRGRGARRAGGEPVRPAGRGVKTIGVLPQGFPPLTVPTVALGDLPELFLGAVAIAVVALADTMSTASSFAARRGERVRGDQEMIGIGAANIFAGFFQGFPVSTSGSRTAVSEQAGSRSQVTGIVGAAVITVVLVFATGVMQYVPQPTLGAIVIAAALSLADIPATRRLWNQRRTEFGLSMAAFLGVALLGVLPGILLAIMLSILNVFRRVWWPHRAELGRVEGLAGLHDTDTYPHSQLLPGLVVYRFDAPLIFANSRMFGDAVRGMAEEQSDLRWVLVAAEPMTDVDTTAADMLAELDSWLNARGVSLAFAEVKDPVREKIQRYELERTIDPAHFYPTLDEAVAAYMAETGATWQDPVVQPQEERP